MRSDTGLAYMVKKLASYVFNYLWLDHFSSLNDLVTDLLLFNELAIQKAILKILHISIAGDVRFLGTNMCMSNGMTLTNSFFIQPKYRKVHTRIASGLILSRP